LTGIPAAFAACARPVSLDCLTALDVCPAEMIRAAARAGFGAVSLWVQAPILPGGKLVTRENAAKVRHALEETGVQVGNLEVFNLNTADPVAAFEPALALGAELGGGTATAIDYGPDRPDIAERFAQFHQLAARHGIDALIEPVWQARIRTMGEAVAMIEAAGVDAGVVLDCLHFVRAGVNMAELAAHAHRIAHVQLCDGPATIAPERIGEEATVERLYPGEGAFPLADIVRHVPPTASIGVEVPGRSRSERGIGLDERFAELAEATATLLQMRSAPEENRAC